MLTSLATQFPVPWEFRVTKIGVVWYWGSRRWSQSGTGWREEAREEDPSESGGSRWPGATRDGFPRIQRQRTTLTGRQAPVEGREGRGEGRADRWKDRGQGRIDRRVISEVSHGCCIQYCPESIGPSTEAHRFGGYGIRIAHPRGVTQNHWEAPSATGEA